MKRLMLWIIALLLTPLTAGSPGTMSLKDLVRAEAYLLEA